MDNLDTGMLVITIMLNQEDQRPEIDLGGVPPAMAIVIFQQAADCLEQTIMEPKISYNGTVIYDFCELEETEDEDDF